MLLLEIKKNNITIY